MTGGDDIFLSGTEWGHMSDFAMTIGGRPVSSDHTFPVVNPATEQEFARAPQCSPGQLDEAMESAAAAFGGWRRNEDARRLGLRESAPRLAAASGEIAALLTAEQGKPLPDAARE